MPTTHQPVPEDLEFKRTAHEERHLLETVDVPVVTVSATFKGELEEKFGEKPETETPEVTFSRAHYSMANAIVVAATKRKKSFWMIDPTNYVSASVWPKVMFTEKMGRLIARSPVLKELKDLMDTRVRNQLPLTSAIREPLTYLAGRIERPVISLHYEAGNILLENGKTVLQVVTDPHVRPQYLTHAGKNVTWAVFDDKTKAELLELGYILGHKIDEKRVVVTGCPVDPRIPVKDKNQAIRGFRRRPLRLAITTGGLGTNKGEIEELLHHLTPSLKNKSVQVIAYAGVHHDFYSMFESYAKDNHVRLSDPDDLSGAFRVLRASDIVDANELLLDYVFPWADGFITKPSGDMAYEAVAAGCFLLTLQPWGEWEENIRAHFESQGVSVRAKGTEIVKQLEALTTVPVYRNKPWVELALERSRRLSKVVVKGADNIVSLHQQLSRNII